MTVNLLVAQTVREYECVVYTECHGNLMQSYFSLEQSGGLTD